MKPTMLFALIALIMIVIVTSFDMQLAPSVALQIPENMAGQALYVCPSESQIWGSVSQMLRPVSHYITIVFFFIVMLLAFNWGWALYQNLLSDSFKKESFSKPWQFTKMTFWAGVVVLLLVFTPNHFRTVRVDGARGEWVLCESNTPGAVAVKAESVHN